MRVVAKRSSFVVVSVALLWAGSAAASNSTTVVPNPDAFQCSQPGFIGFENLPDGTNLSANAIGGVQFTTTGGFTWLVGDFGTGNYNGKYPSGAYTSQGTHWAWLGVTQPAGRIDFVNGPASIFSLLVSNGSSSVYLEAYNSSDTLLETAGPAATDSGTGAMTELAINRPMRDIAYVIVHDSGNFFLVDSICTDAPGVNGGSPVGAPALGAFQLLCLTAVLGVLGMMRLRRVNRRA